MTTKTISQLPATASLDGTEEVPVWKDSDTKRFSLITLLGMVVRIIGNQTIAGIKTFTDGIVVPTGSLPQTATTSLTADLAAKALDSAVVKLAGAQTKAGILTFSDSPTVPTPTTPTQAAPKSYVDAAMPVFPVGPPAAGSATGKDNAAVTAAVTAASAATRGGVVLFGPGLYNYTGGPILLPENIATGKQVSLKGAGDGNATIIYTPTDGTAGQYLIAGTGTSSAGGGSYKTLVEDITFMGPDAFVAYSTGRTPCNLSGLMLDTHIKVNRCQFLGFRYGFNSAGNHNVIRDSKFSNCYVGARFTATAGLGGDVLLDNVDLAGNTLASVSIANNAVATWHAVKGHMGFAPWAVLIESGASVGTLNMYYCVFDGTSFEYLGNGMIHNPGQTSRIDEIHWRNCANFSINNATYGLAATPFANYVFVQGMTNFSFVGGAPAGTTTAAMFDVLTSVGGSIQPCLAGMTAAAAAGVAYVRGPAGQNQASVDLLDRNFRGVAVPCDSSNAVTAKTLVEWTQFGLVRPHAQWGAGARTVLAGVARNGVSASSRDYVLVAQESPDQEILMTGGVDPTATQVLVPSSTTASSVMPANSRGYLTGSTTVDLASLAADTSTTFTITVTGALTTDYLNVTCSGALEDGLVFTAYISAANTVTVRVRNVSAGAIDAASRTWIATTWDSTTGKQIVGQLYLAVAGSASVRARIRFR